MRINILNQDIQPLTGNKKRFSVKATNSLVANNGGVTTYEDAEDGDTEGWGVYDRRKEGDAGNIVATISNVLDTEKNSKVIEFKGNSTQSGYRYGHNNATHTNAWGDTQYKVISWEMKFDESMVVYIPVQTTLGFRYLYYTSSYEDRGIHPTSSYYIHNGLGANTRNGAWHTINRDLEADLQKFEPNNQIVSVNGFLIRGSGRIDNLATLAELPPTPPVPTEIVYEDAEDENTNGWDVYDRRYESNDTIKASFSNVLDDVKNSRVIQLTGLTTRSGYRLGHNNASNPKAWGNRDHKIISWDSKYNEALVVYIPVQTTLGFRYLYYTAVENNIGIHSVHPFYIHHGLGTNLKDGTWHTTVRDLQADLHDYEPNNQIISVNGYLTRGSGLVDNIKLLSALPDTVAPVITIIGGNVSLVEGTEYSDAGANATDNHDGTVDVVTTGSVNTAAAGIYTISYTATDSAGNSATATRTVTITAIPNIVPVANAGENQSTQINTAITLTGSGTDSDGTIASYSWTENGTEFATTANASYTPTSVGTHTLALTVTDNDGATTTDTITIEVTPTPNIAPTANAGADQTTVVNTTITLTGSGTDSDGTIDSYSWSENGTEFATTATASYTPTSVGSHTLAITVTDNGGATATDSITVLVTTDVVSTEITVISPPSNSNIVYSFITLQVETTALGVKAINKSLPNNTIEYNGVKNGDSFLIYNVFLQEGSNEIELTTTGGSATTTLLLNSESKGFAPVYLSLDQDKAFESLTTTATANHKTLTVSQYLFDQDGDRVIDITSTDAIQQLTFPAAGAYKPSVIVKTTDNILYANIEHLIKTVNILTNPIPQSTVVTGVSNTVYDLEELTNYIFALTDNTIVILSKEDKTIIKTINLSGFTNPRGFTLDSRGNIFIADTGADRIAVLLASNDYQLYDGLTINTPGSENGELSSPMDVTLSDDGVFVLDSGNNRIQLFDYTGQYKAQFNGSTTPQGALNNPLNMIGAPNIIITDAGNNIVREIRYKSSTNTETGTQLATLSNMGKVTSSPKGIIVPDNNSSELLYLRNDGTLLNKLPMDKDVLVGLSYEHDHQLFYTCKQDANIKHVYIEKTTPELAPKALTEKFVQAYLANNIDHMQNITSQVWIDKLKTKDVKVREAFSHMTSYNEKVYMAGVKAVVFAKTQLPDGEVTIKFYYNWVSDRWVLNKVL